MSTDIIHHYELPFFFLSKFGFVGGIWIISWDAPLCSEKIYQQFIAWQKHNKVNFTGD